MSNDYSELTACAGGPAPIRSMRAPSGGSARRSSGRCRGRPRRRLLVGRDTRESGEWIARELAHGAAAAGADVTSAGVIPTPAVAYLTRERDFDAGVVISASHNPFEDNGIKVFPGRARSSPKRSSAGRGDGGGRLVGGARAARPAGRRRGPRRPVPRARARAPCRRPAPARAARGGGLRERGDVDVAPRLFGELGSTSSRWGRDPTAQHQLDCGSTHPGRAGARCRRKGLPPWRGVRRRRRPRDLRRRPGRIVDGDAVMFLCARQLQRERHAEAATRSSRR